MERGAVLALSGCLLAAGAYVRMALPLGLIDWGVSFYVAAAGLLLAGVGFALASPARGARLAGAGLAVAALAALNVVRLILQYPTFIDVTALGLIAVGLAGGAWGLLAPRSPAWLARGDALLLAAAGGATYFVHDVWKGIEGQWLADALLLSGFTLLWYGARRLPLAQPRAA